MKRLLLAMFVACGTTQPSTRAPITASAQLPIGAEVTIVESGDATYAFDRAAVTIVRGGRVVARVGSPLGTEWQAGTTLGAPDGAARWVVGLAGAALWRIDPTGTLDAIDDRLGIAAPAQVLAIDSAGPTTIIGLADGALVISQGSHATRFAGFAAPFVAASRDRVAIASPGSLAVFDLAKSARTTYAIDRATQVGFRDATTQHATLAVAAGGNLYEEDHGTLVRRRTPTVDQLALSGARLWFRSDGGLFVEDTLGQVVALALAEPGRLSGSRTGDVWVSGSSKTATRYAFDAPRADQSWRVAVEPVFARACAKCHLPGGDADLDLSTAAAWEFRRREIIERVLVARTMPPAGSELNDDARHSIETWLRAPR